MTKILRQKDILVCMKNTNDYFPKSDIVIDGRRLVLRWNNQLLREKLGLDLVEIERNHIITILNSLGSKKV